MAVSGSGGWVPSARCLYENGELITVGYTQNKPPDIVYSTLDKCKPLSEAVEKLRGGEAIEVDMRCFLTLRDMMEV